MKTAFLTDERCFWHGGGNYAFMAPVGGLVQPLPGGLPENPETKRRLKNLVEVTGLAADLDMRTAAPATDEELARVHPEAFLKEFKAISDAGGGETGLRAPIGPGSFEMAALSAGLARDAVLRVLEGRAANAYALSRPPGHHCLPDWQNGFCLLANIAIAIEAARVVHPGLRAAVLDWDVHHGNGTEAIYAEDPDILTVSIHQEFNYPLDTGGFDVRGAAGTNLNLPLPPGVGHEGYLAVMERLALPAIRAHNPNIVIVACGFDAALFDPLGRMMATAETFRIMTDQVMSLADEVCDGRLAMVHEGGYSEVYVPFCGHGVLERLSQSPITAPDPFEATARTRQPGPEYRAWFETRIDAMADAL